MWLRRTFALAATVLAVTLTGCAAGEGDGGEDGDDPSGSTSIDAALLECGEATTADPTWQLLDVDLTEATWAMPTGFVETFDYSEDLPVEHIESFWVAEPQEAPVALNVLTVVVYSQLDWGEDADECGRVPTTAVDDRLVAYNEHTGAEPLTEVEATEIAGLPALRQDLALAQYSYRGYWLFSRDQMIHLYCQWTNEAEKPRVLAGCDELVASLVVPGA